MSQCPDCRNEFVQPFVCATCGAEKLYDATVREQASQIKRLTTLLNRTHIVLGLLTDDIHLQVSTESGVAHLQLQVY